MTLLGHKVSFLYDVTIFFAILDPLPHPKMANEIFQLESFIISTLDGSLDQRVAISFWQWGMEDKDKKHLFGIFHDLNPLLYFFSHPKYYFVSATSGTPLTPYHHPWGRFSNHHEKIRFMIKMVQGVWKNMVQCLFCKYLGNKLSDF